MARRLKDHIEEALENLTAEDLKRFKRKLNEAKLEPGYNAVPRGRLQNRRPIGVADIIVNFYRDEYGLRLTARVLQAINQKPLADRLLKAAADELHFLDRHRKAIITRTPLPLPIILNLLLQQMLTGEQYWAILAKGTPENMMRELFVVVNGWGRAGKDKLYAVLKVVNPFLISDLEGK